jgi:hypothetical protein
MRTGILLASSLIIIFSIGVKKANARGIICLFDSTSIYVKDNLTATVDINRAFEIISEAGQEYATVAIPVNDNIGVTDIGGFTELRGGARVRLAKGDIGISSSVGLGGFGGTRLVIFSLRNPAIGSRLYYHYRLNLKSLLYLPRMTRNTEYSTKRFSVDVAWDKKVNMRYDASGVEINPGDRYIHFGASDLDEIPDEANSCPDQLYIMLSAEAFSYNRMKYRSRTWPEVGRFFAQLAIQPEGSMALTNTLAHRLSQSARTRLDTLTSFFNFVADSVSYVSLQMGKGDFNPHECSVIINRRFGDCKDQSVLLTSLCQSVGLEAYPALIFTGNYPALDSLHPWPAWFDHVVTVIKNAGVDVILDPSDPRASVVSLPPRLRGKSYLICDGISGLKNAPPEVDPAFVITWQFSLQKILDNHLNVDFNLSFINDAADIYEDSWKGKEPSQIMSQIESQLLNSGWSAKSFELDSIRSAPDSLIIPGSFSVGLNDLSSSGNLAIPSPVLIFLFDNYFSDVRKNDFCPGGSIQLEEKIIIDRSIPGLVVASQFNESWERPGLLFKDELAIDEGHAIYHRLFFSSGDPVKVEDYNSFRDFILSRRNQQYVKLQK